MKACVKATGEIVEVKSKVITSPITGKSLLKYVSQKTGISYFEEELSFPKDLADDPDYWTHLEHQAAIAAMQGKMAQGDNFGNSREDVCNKIANYCIDVADALIKKLKEKEERK